jgi:hypothetical protein
MLCDASQKVSWETAQPDQAAQAGGVRIFEGFQPHA